MLVQTWEEGALNRSSINDAGKLAGTGELIAHADRILQRIWPLMARSRPDEFASMRNLTLVGSPAICDLVDVIDIIRCFDASNRRLNIYSITELYNQSSISPALYRRSNKLVSRAKTGDPVNGTPIRLFVLDAPARLVDYTSVIDDRFPGRHEQMLVDHLAVYLGVKDAGRSSEDRKALIQDLGNSVQAFAAEFELAPADVQWLHAGAERAGMVGRGSNS